MNSIIPGLYFYTLLVFTISIYGASWILTFSHISSPVREMVFRFSEKVKGKFLIGTFMDKLSYLLNCIVCTSVWVTLALLLLAGESAMLSTTFPPLDLIDYLIWMGYGAGTTWMLATKFDQLNEIDNVMNNHHDH
tara:strand:+ start:3563 stop:3967 length:405 start_codon:yes stop_codon:yes gene_type:complete